MPEMHLRQSGFICSACGPFSKRKNKKIKQTGDSRYIHQNELDNACFQHDMSFGDFKDRVDFDKELRDEAFDIAKGPKYDGCQLGLASVVYKFFDKNLCHTCR